MLEHDAYRRLATFNRLVVDGRQRVEQQKERVLSLADQPTCSIAVAVLRELQRSLRLLMNRRDALIKQLIQSPFWIECRRSQRDRSGT